MAKENVRGKTQTVTEDDIFDTGDRDPAGRSDAELDELERQYLSPEDAKSKQDEEEKEEKSSSFASLGKTEDESKPEWELTEDGAIVNQNGEDEEFVFKMLNNGEMLECEVERRKLLGGSLFPPIISQDGSVISDPMNDIALMMAIMKRAVTAPKNYLANEINGFDSDYLDRIIPVYKAYQEWRERELESTRKKSKKIGSKFAS